MQKSTLNRFNQGTTRLISQLKPLLTEPFFEEEVAPVTLLPVEPLFQRKLFLKMAVEDQREVFLQLMPATSAGSPINVRGHLKQLADGRYLLTAGKKSYFFALKQVRYIAG